LLIIVKN